MELKRSTFEKPQRASQFWLAWLLIAVLALATVCGPELDSAHPKPDLKGNPHVSQSINGDTAEEQSLVLTTLAIFGIPIDINWRLNRVSFNATVEIAISTQRVSFQAIRILLRWLEFPTIHQRFKPTFQFSR